MAKIFFSTISCLVLILIINISNPTVAYAHGLGGIEPSKSSSKVERIDPSTSIFTAKTIENGQRLQITLLQNKVIEILGVDSEPYIRMTNQGVYINELSPTRVINQSTALKSLTELKKEFDKTSNNPNEEPVWEKISNNKTYTFHDHRAHYMGTVPNRALNLGTSELPVKANGTIYNIKLTFFTKKSANPLLPLSFLLIPILGIFIFVGIKRDSSIQLFNKNIFLIGLIVISLFEAIHVVGYMKFSHRKFGNELSASFYSFILIILCVYSIYKLIITKNNWLKTLHKNAPLLCATGFIGLVAGCVIEFKNLIEPFPATTIPLNYTRVLIISIGILSSIIFSVSLVNIKAIPHSEEQ